jgi:hypothetical protein
MGFKFDRAIIGQPYGGLGDNLQFSTLPEMFAKRGIETYISNENYCRNPQIYEMVWGMNPFVKGFIYEPPNITVVDVEKSPRVFEMNTVQRAELLYFDAWEHNLPVIFYQPKPREDFANKMVLEFGFVTVNLTKQLDRIKEHLAFITEGQEPVLLKNLVNKSLDIGDYPTYEVKDIFELADILFSCRAFAGIESGAAVLCATVKRETKCDGIYVFCRPIHQAMRAFVYTNQTLVVL